MELKDLLNEMKEKIEKGEDTNKVFNESKKEFKNYDTETKKYWKDKYDKEYEVDIHIYRKSGMGNSVQMVKGNRVSVLTATMSYLQTLVDNNVITKEKLLKFIKDDIKED